MNGIERSTIDSDLLRTFLAVAAAGGVTAAGERLGRTQSAVSVQVGKLEQALSIRLFHRQARGMSLTEAGETLIPVAREALEGLDRVAELFAHPLTGRVRVGVPDDYGTSMLERVLASFAARHPGVEVAVRCGFSVGFPEAIRRDELDLAIHTAEVGDAPAPVRVERTVWAAHPGLCIAPDEPVPLALFDRACWWRQAALDALAQAGRPYRVAYSSESAAGVNAAIAAGLAVGVLAETTVDPSMRVLGPDDGFPSLPGSALVILKGDDAGTAAIGAMEDALRAAMGYVAAR